MADNLEQMLAEADFDIVGLLRNNQTGAKAHGATVPEISNWRDEQWAMRHGAALLDLSQQLVELRIEGPDALKLLTETMVNSPGTLTVNRAIHYVSATLYGHVIGDGIVHPLADEEFLYVGRAPAANWLTYQAQKFGYDAEITGVPRQHGSWRFRMVGPHAVKVIQKLGGPSPDRIERFRLSTMQVGTKTVQSMGLATIGSPGIEIWGPYEDHDYIRDTILQAGEEFGLTPVGSRALPSANLESGRLSGPLPAIYSGEQIRDYRKWLDADSYEATCSIGGSFVGDQIEDYYLTPWELGYGPLVEFDHDFHGADALKESAEDKDKLRNKVTLEWYADDVKTIVGSMFEPEGEQYKFFDLPDASYATASYDRVVDADGCLVGLSLFTGYSWNEKKALSLATVGPQVPMGAELQVIWGEENGGTNKPTTEPHKQIGARAIVSPAPFSPVSQSAHIKGWRAS
ncbi:aminomethyl transferase family protein [Aurantiacibacter zhengii]|nr:aminomethyl transferase family protein [Aurantiacibacter zhengii]